MWVKDVGGGRVVQYQGLVQVSAQSAKIFDIAALVEHTRLSEQTGAEHAALVQQVCHRVSVL